MDRAGMRGFNSDQATWDRLEKLYQHYLRSMQGEAHRPLSRNKFSDALVEVGAELGITRTRDKFGSKFIDIRVNSPEYHL